MSADRRNLVIAIVVAFVFGVSGGLIGALGAVAFVHHRGGPPAFMAGPDRPGARGERMRPGRPGRPRMESILRRELGLSDEQRERIETILDDARPRYAAVRESTHAEILRVLTPEQQVKWNELEERMPGRRGGRAERR